MFTILAAAASSPPIWPIIVSAIIGATAVLGSTLFAGITQRKYARIQRENDLQKQHDKNTANSIAAQVDLTKDVLDNWKDIVRNLGEQIGDLHGQVAGLEDRERRCQIELMGMKARVLEIEGRLAPKTGGGNL